MDFKSLVLKRYSVRNYRPDPVEEEKLSYILECGRMAPSAANFQPWKIHVVENPQLKEQLHATYPRDWFRQAPVILVFTGDHKTSWKRADGKDHLDIDLAILIDHITLAAAEVGLGTCWICNFNAQTCREILQLAGNEEPIAYLPLGYPSNPKDDNSRHSLRKPAAEIIRFIR